MPSTTRKVPTRPHHSRPLSLDLTATPGASSLYSMLPSSVSNRLPRIPSLRRSMTMYSLRPAQSAEHGAEPATETNFFHLEEEEEGPQEEEPQEKEIPTQMRPSSSPAAVPMPEMESKSGLNWKYAAQGLNVLNLSFSESRQSPSAGPRSITRDLYIHAITYLLRALPPSLEADEASSITSALPKQIVYSPSQQLLPTEENHGQNQNQSNQRDIQPSFLHRAFSATVLQLFLIFSFIFPYIRAILSQAHDLDRKHNLSGRALAVLIVGTDKLARNTVGFGERLVNVGDGKVGQIMMWGMGEMGEAMKEVVGGVAEGVGEGLSALGETRRKEYNGGVNNLD
ncbi:MAG: hypothetical protein M1834_007130 [Cirrosporium novae-zelandiae]|nr:MAG: hypothetical protein M1834_007130 [Cirrosporium novae-zelandiae]